MSKSNKYQVENVEMTKQMLIKTKPKYTKVIKKNLQTVSFALNWISNTAQDRTYKCI